MRAKKEIISSFSWVMLRGPTWGRGLWKVGSSSTVISTCSMVSVLSLASNSFHVWWEASMVGM